MANKIDIKNKINELRPRLTDKAINLYFRTITNIGKFLTGETEAHKINDFDFLLDVQGVMNYFREKDFSKSTQITYLGQILSVFESFNCVNNYEYSNILDTYGEILETLIVDRDKAQKENPNIASPKQLENWLDWEEIKSIHANMKETLEHLELPAKKMSVDERTLYENYVILSLYVADEDNPPLRNDYANMRVIKKDDEDDDEGNFLVLKAPMRFVLNSYKTSKTYGKATIKVGKKLKTILLEYLKYHKTGHLINDAMGEPISHNVLTQRLTKIFQQNASKNVSTQILRHSYITHHLPPDTRARNNLSKKMLHSPKMNLEYALYLDE